MLFFSFFGGGGGGACDIFHSCPGRQFTSLRHCIAETKYDYYCSTKLSNASKD